jgi:hypothetical protein
MRVHGYADPWIAVHAVNVAADSAAVLGWHSMQLLCQCLQPCIDAHTLKECMHCNLNAAVQLLLIVPTVVAAATGA